MRARVGRRSCAHLAESLLMITNRMYGSMCGSRASEPSSRSRLSACTIRARMVGAGVSERGARWLVAELCAHELPAHPLGTAQRLLPARLAICAAGLLNWPPGCTRCPQTGWAGKLGTASRLTLLCHARTQMPVKGPLDLARPHLLGRRAPPHPLGELVGGGGAIMETI